MKNILLKLVGIAIAFLFINNVYACWASGWISNCSLGDINIVIINDTNYTLAYSSSQNQPKISNPDHIILPGGSYTASASLGDSSGSVGGSVYIAVSDEGNYYKMDNITASVRYHRDYVCDNHGNCGYNGQGYFHDFHASHNWFVIDGLPSIESLYAISTNGSNQSGYDSYVFDYTIASSNPSSLPPGSNPWGNTQYAPSPYQNN